MMDTPVLGGKSQFPADDIVFSHIGKAKPLWVALFKHLDDEHPDFTRQWRYYNDGWSWLMKVQQKKKTVFWLSVLEGSFRTTFYIHDRGAKLVEASAISDALKEQFRTGKHYGRLRGITVVFKNKKDLEFAKELIGIKLNL